MLRNIIKIDESKCNGCGLCAEACHEGAIALENGKAKLQREDYCDGLGDCLPACPMNAITFEIREAPAYNAEAVLAAKMPNGEVSASGTVSELGQWPVQIKLVPVKAPYFEGADLLIAADCSAYARANFHDEFIRGKVTLIGCPKLDGVDYSQKLAEILQQNNIKTVTVVRMEVPCCGGLKLAVAEALNRSGKTIPWQVITLSIQGEVMETSSSR
jgi:NAD-dependent dihydropyrimidine dehydrogenase PreA subunit